MGKAKEAYSFFNPDGSLKNESEIVRILKSANSRDLERVFSTMSPEELRKLLRRFKIMLERLIKEVLHRLKSGDLWVGSLSFEEIYCLSVIIKKELDNNEYCSSLIEDNQREQATIQKIVNIINKKPEVTKPRISAPAQTIEQPRMIESIVKTDGVNIGDCVTIRYCDESDEYTFSLVSTREDHDSLANRICVDSPLGMAVYGQKLGNKFDWKVDRRVFAAFVVDIKKKQKLDENEQVHRK